MKKIAAWVVIGLSTIFSMTMFEWGASTLLHVGTGLVAGVSLARIVSILYIETPRSNDAD